MNATVGAVTSSSAGWAGMAQHMAAQAQLVTLVAAGVFLLILLLVGLFQTGDEVQATPGENLVPDFGMPSWSIEYGVADQAGGSLVAVGVATERRTTRAVRASTGELSPSELAALAALRDRVRDRDIGAGRAVAQRLSFARWLVEHGRLEG